jgi:hypothetical protein
VLNLPKATTKGKEVERQQGEIEDGELAKEKRVEGAGALLLGAVVM